MRIVEIPPANLKRRLARNRIYDRICETSECVICPYGKLGDCAVSGVVYLIACLSCGQEYVGETGRPLMVRVKEHLDGLNRSIPGTPLGAHRRQSHGNLNFEIKVTILSYEKDIVARKTLEAFWITAKNPKINRKEECLSITSELAAFQDLCRF